MEGTMHQLTLKLGRIGVLFLLTAFWLAGIAMETCEAQDFPTKDDVKFVLEDDSNFSRLLTEIWVLRDLLALYQGGDISVQVTNFQDLQDTLRNDQDSLVKNFSSNPRSEILPNNLRATAITIADRLDRFGVRRESDLGKRLVKAYLLYSKILVLDSLDPLCTLHPFQELC